MIRQGAVESIQTESESIRHGMDESIHHRDESIHTAYYRMFMADNIEPTFAHISPNWEFMKTYLRYKKSHLYIRNYKEHKN